jgi:hypothetical protein
MDGCSQFKLESYFSLITEQAVETTSKYYDMILIEWMVVVVAMLMEHIPWCPYSWNVIQVNGCLAHMFWKRS